jgi:DNA modification methylase
LANNADENDGATRNREVQNGIDKAFQYKTSCPKCGAIRIDSQIGLEATPEAYVAKLVAVFREVRRVLRDDGTVWLNLGDSYAGGAGGRSDNEKSRCGDGGGDPGTIRIGEGKHSGKRIPNDIENLKPKDLIGIPWRVAFALQADGWWLRSDIIWHKPNPMPESVTDRCTKSHEYIFLLTKSAKYFYDAEAAKEPATSDRPDMATKGIRTGLAYLGQGLQDNSIKTSGEDRSKRDSFKRENSKRAEVFPGQSMGTHRMEREESTWDIATRNRRSVWTISTKPFKEAHFATFPPEIPEICIKAGSKVGDTVLDPFSGAGTTGLVAEKLGRKFIGIELNPTYVSMSESRIYSQCGGLLNGC